MARITLIALLAALSCLGCKPGDFDTLESEAPIKAITAPGYFERVGFGLGLAYPIPITLNFGFPFKYDEDDGRQVFSFSLGGG